MSRICEQCVETRELVPKNSVVVKIDRLMRFTDLTLSHPRAPRYQIGTPQISIHAPKAHPSALFSSLSCFPRTSSAAPTQNLPFISKRVTLV